MKESSPQRLARLLQLVRSLESDMGMATLSKAEKLLFTSLADLSTPANPEVNIEQIVAHPDLKAMPAPTMYKCLRDLQTKGMLEKIGTPRSGKYKLA
ncbi:MAG: hypothetical protein QGG88_01270 [Gammaproteobacteria bacterium]|jgi:hypothetical protein|nr:hypothetical protein [Gammaproteobacteria bacterium]